ncbi:MAG TPA: M56 family metallopeptidase [Chitinophagaceae bacterium]|nr:M56 family metallopeptidase [Chitinophagaceae bacterium]
MTTYIIKVILCSAVFLFTYKLLLEKQRMHLFNRFYLLSSLLLSFVIPLITFSSSSPILAISEIEILNSNILKDKGVTQILSPEESTNYIFPILLTIYITITTVLFLRLIVNLKKILFKAWTQRTLPYKKSKIVLIEEDLTPHSFLNYLFINAKEYRNGDIENEILVHEYAHIRQKHSYDILFTEIVQTVFWFNPFVFFYIKAIRLNHEFLADEAVINTSQNITSYQYILIDNANKCKTYNLTSQFNYSIIKKRLVMITKPKSLRNTLCRQIALIPVLALSIFVFSTKSIAQTPVTATKSILDITPSTQEGVTQELLNEYEQIVNRAKNDKGNPVFNKFSDADKFRLETIYLAMSKGQQRKQIVIFLPAPTTPLPRIVPTQAQIESWKNPDIYGVWINDKRIGNSELNKYKNTDFAQVFISYLHKNARTYGKHSYQVNLMTTKEYETYRNRTMETKNKYHLAITYPKRAS